MNIFSTIAFHHYRPRPVPCPGTHLVNVFLLRTPDDANQINAIVSSKEVYTCRNTIEQYFFLLNLFYLISAI